MTLLLTYKSTILTIANYQRQWFYWPDSTDETVVGHHNIIVNNGTRDPRNALPVILWIHRTLYIFSVEHSVAVLEA